MRRRTAGRESEEYSFTDSVFYWTGILEARYNRAFILAMRPKRVTIPMWRVLACLAELESLTVGEIARLTQVERTALSRLLERLQRAGMVERAECLDDRRVSETRITAAGRAAFLDMLPVRRAVFSLATAGIDARDLLQIRSTVDRMITNLDSAGGHPIASLSQLRIQRSPPPRMLSVRSRRPE